MQLSIIIPILNESEGIKAFVDSLLASISNCSEHIELVFVDGGSEDGSVEFLKSYLNKFDAKLRWQIVFSEPGRAKQMNTAASAAKGSYFVFLHADTQLPPRFERSLEDIKVSQRQWGFFPVQVDGPGWHFRLLSMLINLRSKISAVSTGDQCQFFSRSTFFKNHGFVELPLMEDVEISKRFRRQYRPFIGKQKVRTSARRWLESGFIKVVVLMWILRFAYFIGVSPQRLAEYYRNVR